jgi:ribosomal protein L13E
MSEVHVHLSPAQARKAAKGATFQVTADALQESPNTVIIMAKKADASRMKRNQRNGKGFRFQNGDYSMHEVEGGRLNLKKSFNKAASKAKAALKKGVNNASKQAEQYAVQKANQYENEASNYATEQANRYTNKLSNIAQDKLSAAEREVVKRANNLADQGLSKMESLAGGRLNLKKAFNKAASKAKSAVKKGVNNASKQAEQYAVQKANQYENDAHNYANEQANRYSDKLSNIAQDKLSAAERDVVKRANNLADQGIAKMESLAGKGVKKGTQAAKDKMAALRAMRGKNSAKGGKLNFKKAFKKVGRVATSVANKAVNNVSQRAEDYAVNEGKKALKQASRGAVKYGIEGLKQVSDYVVPGSDVLLESQFNKLERKANRDLDKRIDGLGINDTFISHNNPASTAQIQLKRPNKRGSRLKGDQSIRGGSMYAYGFRGSGFLQ